MLKGFDLLDSWIRVWALGFRIYVQGVVQGYSGGSARQRQSRGLLGSTPTWERRRLGFRV